MDQPTDCKVGVWRYNNFPFVGYAPTRVAAKTKKLIKSELTSNLLRNLLGGMVIPKTE